MQDTAAALSDLAPIDGPQAWTGPAMKDRHDEWSYTLTPSDIDELYGTARKHIDAKRSLLELEAGTFALPGLQSRLAQIRRDILSGRGFALLRGLPVADHSMEENAFAFWGLGLHLGNAVPQNGKNHMLGHVKNLGLDYARADVRGYQTNARLPYHTDYSDIVGLLCLNTAKSGGLSSFVSSVTLYNELLKINRELAATLTMPVPRTRWSELDSDQLPWSETPVFSPLAGTVITSYVRSAIRKSQDIPQAPRVSAKQEEAFDLLDKLAQDPALHLDMEFAAGDMQFLNNHWILHSRTAYEDHADLKDRRHLLRLWLACTDGPPLPQTLLDERGATPDGRPGGIHVPGKPRIASLDPTADTQAS